MMGWFGWLDDIVSPLFDSLRFIAPVAWVPFAALWFGTGIGGPTLIIFAGAFPPCLINAYRGAKNVDIRFLEAASMLGVGNFRTITEVLFPAAVPSIIAGLRIGAGLGWMSLVGAELIVASSGMGNLIVRAQSAVATDIVMAGMLAIGAVGVVIDILIRRIETMLLKHRQS
jgi:NitT/TauT family transport system permease protein